MNENYELYNIAIEAGNKLIYEEFIKVLKIHSMNDKLLGLNKDQRLMLASMRIFTRFDAEHIKDIIFNHYEEVLEAIG